MEALWRETELILQSLQIKDGSGIRLVCCCSSSEHTERKRDRERMIMREKDRERARERIDTVIHT